MRVCDMSSNSVLGRVNSIQSLGTVDGPGIRYVVFLQGCNLRCGCCHNPDTWDINGGDVYDAQDIAQKAQRYKSYFGQYGGITISGGEPLLQADFVKAVFSECHLLGINTCLDTSGCILNQNIKDMLEVTDRVLLDIKYTDEKLYREFVGGSLQSTMEFLDYLESVNIPVVIRQVIIPGLNDDEDSVTKLRQLVSRYRNVEKVELLPFKKICKSKYDNLNIPFRFESFDTPSAETMEKLNNIINK